MIETSLGAISVERVIDGRFPLLQEIGGTEWSSAYLTELDDGTARKAAIKIFPFEALDLPTTTARWELAETVSHPHLMPLFCSGRCEFEGKDLLYVVTDYADETLSQILPARPLSPGEARAMLEPVLEALAFLHERGLTHGHLRPTNIMVIDDKVKLSPDFGWSSRIPNIYDPPEAATGTAAPAADIWSLGILLVEALTQQLPAWDRSQGGEPEIPANLPEPFFTICRECLRSDAERRCTLAKIKELLDPPPAAEPAAQPAEAAEEAADVIDERPAKPSYRFRAMMVGGAVLVLSLMLGAFRIGWNLTPATPAAAAQPEVTVSAATPAPRAATPPAPPAKPAAAAPARDSSVGGVVKGAVVYRALPDIPGKIADTVQGHFKVGVRVEVNAAGKVAEAAIESQGPSAYFAKQALQAAQSWRFTPATVDGRAAASTWLLEFQFGQSQSAATESEEAP